MSEFLYPKFRLNLLPAMLGHALLGASALIGQILALVDSGV